MKIRQLSAQEDRIIALEETGRTIENSEAVCETRKKLRDVSSGDISFDLVVKEGFPAHLVLLIRTKNDDFVVDSECTSLDRDVAIVINGQTLAIY